MSNDSNIINPEKDLNAVTTLLDTDLVRVLSAEKSVVMTVANFKILVGSGGGGATTLPFQFPAGSWDTVKTNYAPLETYIMTNKDLAVNKFADFPEEFIKGILHIKPGAGIDPAGTVQFYSFGLSETAAASRNVALKLYHGPTEDGEDLDTVYDTLVSPDLPMNDNQDYLTINNWSETVANLGWGDDMEIPLLFSRVIATSNNLVNDYFFENLIIVLPLS